MWRPDSDFNIRERWFNFNMIVLAWKDFLLPVAV